MSPRLNNRRILMAAAAFGIFALPSEVSSAGRFEMQDGAGFAPSAPCVGLDPGSVIACEIERVIVPTQPIPVE